MTITLSWADVLVIYCVTTFAVIQVFVFNTWLNNLRKRRLVMDFMAAMQERIETEEEFNSIISKFRKDFDGPEHN